MDTTLLSGNLSFDVTYYSKTCSKEKVCKCFGEQISFRL